MVVDLVEVSEFVVRQDPLHLEEQSLPLAALLGAVGCSCLERVSIGLLEVPFA